MSDTDPHQFEPIPSMPDRCNARTRDNAGPRRCGLLAGAPIHDIDPLNTDQIRAEHEAHNYRVTPLKNPHDCDGCGAEGAAKWDMLWNNEGRDEEPFLCDACLAREFREVRLADAYDEQRALVETLTAQLAELRFIDKAHTAVMQRCVEAEAQRDSWERRCREAEARLAALLAKINDVADLFSGDLHAEDCDVDLFAELSPDVRCNCWFGEVRNALQADAPAVIATVTIPADTLEVGQTTPQHRYDPEPVSTGADAPCRFCRQGSRAMVHAELLSAGTGSSSTTDTPGCEHEMYLGFDAPADRCEHGVRVRAAGPSGVDTQPAAHRYVPTPNIDVGSCCQVVGGGAHVRHLCGERRSHPIHRATSGSET